MLRKFALIFFAEKLKRIFTDTAVNVSVEKFSQVFSVVSIDTVGSPIYHDACLQKTSRMNNGLFIRSSRNNQSRAKLER